MAPVSPWEREARRKKVAALTRHITDLVSLLGLTPERDGYLIAELVRGWGDAEWAAACVNVGKPKASVETRLAVLAWFGERERKAS